MTEDQDILHTITQETLSAYRERLKNEAGVDVTYTRFAVFCILPNGDSCIGMITNEAGPEGMRNLMLEMMDPKRKIYYSHMEHMDFTSQP